MPGWKLYRWTSVILVTQLGVFPDTSKVSVELQGILVSLLHEAVKPGQIWYLPVGDIFFLAFGWFGGGEAQGETRPSYRPHCEQL